MTELMIFPTITMCMELVTPRGVEPKVWLLIDITKSSVA